MVSVWTGLCFVEQTTERLPLILRSGNGEIVEVLEFKDRVRRQGDAADDQPASRA